MPTTSNPVVKDVPSAFNAVDAHGVRTDISSGLFNPPNINQIENHFQGIVSYNGYYILSYDDPWTTPAVGVTVIANSTSVTQVPTLQYGPQYCHPGGIQVVGDYLVVGIETMPDVKPKVSKIAFYDLTTMTDTNPPKFLENLTIDRPQGGAGAVGMTSWTDQGQLTYVIAAYDNGKTDFYTANDDFFQGTSTPELAFSTTLGQDGYSSLCMVTDAGNTKWMVGFYLGGGSGDDDLADLLQVSVESKKVSLEKTRHFYYDEGGLENWFGGFRYAAGLQLSASANDFSLLASDRNPNSGKFGINVFAGG